MLIGVLVAAAQPLMPTAAAAPANLAGMVVFIDPGHNGANDASIGREVRNAVYLMLPMGRATADAVAQGLGLSLRTMQRQLDASGESFTDIVNTVRRDLALRYVANPDYSLLRVSGLLGYGSAASFSRWFSAQFGEAPIAWRRRHGGRP